MGKEVVFICDLGISSLTDLVLMQHGRLEAHLTKGIYLPGSGFM
jgi:hypothetical protein